MYINGHITIGWFIVDGSTLLHGYGKDTRTSEVGLFEAGSYK